MDSKLFKRLFSLFQNGILEGGIDSGPVFRIVDPVVDGHLVKSRMKAVSRLPGVDGI